MKKLLILLLFIISLNLAYAAEIEVKDTPVQTTVLPGQSVSFDLTIQNNQNTQDEIKAVIMDDTWRRKSGSEIYNLNAGEEFKDILVLFPITKLKTGTYAIDLRFVSTKNNDIFTDHRLVVTVADYKSVLDAKLEVNPNGIDPRKDNLVKLKLKSLYNINLNNINVHIENSLFSKDIVTSVMGLESKDEDFTVSLNPDTAEGDYDTNIIIRFGSEVLIDKIEALKVSSYSDVKETKEQSSNFLIKTTTIARTNEGNSDSNEVYTLSLSKFEKLFTRFDPSPRSMEINNKGYKFEWRFSLKPGESYNIDIITNYRAPILWIIAIIVIGYLAYNFLRTELFMYKKVLVLKSHEGEIAGIKVLLRLKNKSNLPIKSLYLTDTLPSVLETPHEYHTLKPSSVKKTLSGIMLAWEIPELHKSEERIISYKIKLKQGHKGKLLFHRAVCRYKTNLGKLSVTKSNEVSVQS